jgi:hypothetical protein
MARYVRDIFLPSTSENVREYRDTVTDVVLSRLGQSPSGRRASAPRQRKRLTHAGKRFAVAMRLSSWSPPIRAPNLGRVTDEGEGHFELVEK